MASPPQAPNKLQYSFAGKKVLLTGGGRGVGRQLVSRLYEDGATIFTLEKDPALVSQLLEDFPDQNRLKAEECDITDWKKTQSLIELFGPVDHLVNCAAIVELTDILEIKEEDVDRVLDVNLKSLLCTSQAVAKAMVSNEIKGTIVNIASIAGHCASPYAVLYSTTKAGVLMLTKCLAVNLGKFGIRVNSISPTFIDTPMMLEAMEKFPNIAQESNMFARQPYKDKTMLERDDVVNSILFLLSPLSSIASGIDLALDGGILAC